MTPDKDINETISEDSKRLGDFSRFLLFEPIDEVFRMFKEQFDENAQFYNESIPPNELNRTTSYIASYSTNEENILRLFWVKGEKRIVVEVATRKKYADRHGDGEPNGD